MLPRESGSMQEQSNHHYLERRNAAKNIARPHSLELNKTLFGEACVTRRWERIGIKGKSLVRIFPLIQRSSRLSSPNDRAQKHARLSSGVMEDA
jgi:predicted DNA-binding WGR domain protein